MEPYIIVLTRFSQIWPISGFTISAVSFVVQNLMSFARYTDPAALLLLPSSLKILHRKKKKSNNKKKLSQVSLLI